MFDPFCPQLKDDAVALVDVIAPPDFIVNSPIGKADGEVRDLPLLNTQLKKHTCTALLTHTADLLSVVKAGKTLQAMKKNLIYKKSLSSFKIKFGSTLYSSRINILTERH